MITVCGIHKSFVRQALFEDASLQINEGERLALVGPNGSGKTTLFRMILGDEEPDDGEIHVRRGVRMGYLPQENAPVSEKTILEEALAEHDDPDGRLIAGAKAVLMGLGFKTADFDRGVCTLSGGWAMRVAMAKLLIGEPDLLLLDEPTNHLDLSSLLWLENYLLSHSGAVFVISHDRAFINKVCSAVVSLQDSTLKTYRGDYEYYLAQREGERQRLKAAWQQQQDEIEQMKDFISRNRARSSTASRAQSTIKRLEKLVRIELPAETKTMKMRFPQPKRTGARVLALKNVCKSYRTDEQSEIKVYQGLDFELERGWKMAFVGHNGAGKSTLLKLLAGIITPDSGERLPGHNVKTGYFSQHRADDFGGRLNPEKTVLGEAMDNDRMNTELMARTVLGTFLFSGDAVFKKTKVLSGGEKSRLALVKLLLDPPNVLLMDEPTTHLDMDSVDALIAALKEFEGTICCITHDIYFMNAIADHIVHVDKGNVTVYPGNYEYFQHRQEQIRRESGESPASDSASGGRGSAAGVTADPAPCARMNSKKAQRRQRALEREKAKEIVNLKKDIARYRAEIESLAARMSDPGIYGDYSGVRAMGDEMQKLEDRIRTGESELDRLAGDIRSS